MSGFAEIFPFLAFLAVSGIAIYALVARGKLARGSQSAGPVIAPTQIVHGRSSQTWDTASITADLANHGVLTVGNLADLCRSVGIDATTHYGLSQRAAEVLVDRLEHHLGFEQPVADRTDWQTWKETDV